MQIRLATAEDAVAIAQLINRAYRVETFFVSGDRISPAQVTRYLERGSFHVALDRWRDEGGEKVGGADPAERRAGGPHEISGCVYTEVLGEAAYLGLLSVDPDAQGSGLGRRLMAVAEESCRAGGCRRIDILVVNLRTELPPWYRRLGYRETGTKPFDETHRLLRPCHFVVMSKQVSTEP